MTSRRALLRHVWTMVQTRAEAAALVVSLQRTAVVEAIVFFGLAAVSGLASLTALIVFIAVAAPEAWRSLALLALTLVLVAATFYGLVAGRRKLTRDRGTIADFKRGLQLDMAMVNLALRDPDTADEEKLAAREQAREKVRAAAEEKAATDAAGQQDATGATGSSSAEAALRAVRPTEREMPPAPPLDAGGTGATAPTGTEDVPTELRAPDRGAGRAA